MSLINLNPREANHLGKGTANLKAGLQIEGKEKNLMKNYLIPHVPLEKVNKLFTRLCPHLPSKIEKLGKHT